MASKIVNFFKPRFESIGQAPGRIAETEFCGALFNTVGIIGTVGSLLTLGLSKAMNQNAHAFTKKSPRDNGHAKNMFATPYVAAIDILRPGFYENEFQDSPVKDGLLTRTISKNIFRGAKSLTQPECYWINRNITARLGYALAAAASVITRVADLIIGLVSAAFSFIILGTWTGLNRFAMENLTFSGVIGDASRGLRGFVNPKAALNPNKL